MASRKRKSDPTPRRRTRVPALPAEDSSGTDVTNGEDLENLISAIHGKFKRRTKEQRARAEQDVRETIQGAMATIQKYVLEYEERVARKLDILRHDLQKIKADREEQITNMNAQYKEFKTSMQGMINKIQTCDVQYNGLVHSFFDSMTVLQKQVRGTVREATLNSPAGNNAIVPRTNQKHHD